jgi:glutathione S-transferase
MILIGQCDSPFVRRVAIALRLYDLPFEHRAWSVFGQGEAIRALNPLMRVPTFLLDDGFVLTDSHMILDYLDSLVAEPMFPRTEPARHHALKIATLGTGLAEKAVSLFYERVMHTQTSAVWEARCAHQMGSVLAALEADRAARPGPWWFGEKLGHADIAVACALRFVADAHGAAVDLAPFLALRQHATTCEALAVFAQTYTPFAPPA